jgi:flavorubredoxin
LVAVTPHTTELAPSIHRISTFHPSFGIQFNQFLVLDDEPMLIHTGMRRMFDATLAGVREVMDPARLRWIGFSHFEPDECGELNEWLALAPQAQPVAGMVGAMVMLGDYADRPPRIVADGEEIATGRHRMRFLATPHVPHGWDAGLWFDETSRTLFCSDLCFQPGDPPAVTEADLIPAVRAAIVEGMKGPLAHDIPYTHETDGVLRRLAALAPTTLAIMHGSSYRGDGAKLLLDLAGVLRETIGPG